jgi:hypothetical protein
MTTQQDKPDEEEIKLLQPYDDLPSTDDAKALRCYKFNLYSDDAPRCYTENTSKEELVLEHVLEYARQFKIIYDPTRELLLAPLNECGKRKFICTTIRPTKLPFVELYNYEDCAKFIASYLEYEELQEPNRLPECMPSPANVLEWQGGDSFDFAVVLCSLLVGAGYDSYVVYGTAPKEITTRDESLMDCPDPLDFSDLIEEEDHRFDEDEEKMIEKIEKEPDPVDNYSVEVKPAHKSVWDNEVEDTKQADVRMAQLKAISIDDDEPDYERADPFGKSRLHAWVMIQKGDREMSETIFIEPTTGRKYALDSAPYHSIQAIFNHKNFWINLDPKRDVDEMNLEFQEDINGEWEYVMIGEKKANDEEENEDEDEDQDEDEEEAGQEEEVLDMPPPWSPKLYVNREKFTDRCPNGEKTVFFKKCKVDIYSECKQVDGLIKRITIYKDYKRLITQEIRSYYRCRKDKMWLRRRFPYEFKLVEHYESMPPYHWKKLVQIDGQYKKLYYYHHRN